MNKILQLSGDLSYKKNSGQPGPAEIPKGAVVTVFDLKRLRDSLFSCMEYWHNVTIDIPPIISVYYNDVVAKSNRLEGLLVKGDPNESIIGAKYTKDQSPKHIITHITTIKDIENSLTILDVCIEVLEKNFNGRMSSEQLKTLNDRKAPFKTKLVSKSRFGKIIKDAFYIDRFGIELINDDETNEAQIVNVYDIGLSYNDLIRKLNLQDEFFSKINENTWLLTPKQFRKLQSIAPYIISMNVSDIRELTYDSIGYQPQKDSFSYSIPEPTNEPIIGVIDTLFDGNAYFSSWVDYTCLVPQSEQIDKDDLRHGTAVTSIIVDGPTLNPALDDGCGRFRVKHFGVATSRKTSASKIMERIKSIVESNRHIKVWNLSLGSNDEISDNFISPEAEILDELQYKYNVIFVIAGTNDRKESGDKKIGMPADSINSLVVNSVTFSGVPAKYSRRGPVLSFFKKPDIATFGGNREDPIVVYSNYGRDKMYGTSFAAPWITRKLAYLIYILDFPKEIAKALIIDSAAGWKCSIHDQNFIGFGEVSRHINDIIKTNDDEIKFFIFGISKEYDTYAYNIPIPQSKGKFPFNARATLCYTPKCSRKQGVDYTNTEMDIHFGRIANGKIKPINNNEQGENFFINLVEGKARKTFRKWDNVKYISEGISERSVGKQAYDNKGYWGISIKSKERLNEKSGKDMPFGLVITLKEINGKNRIDEFMALCRAHIDWRVKEIDVETSINTYIAAESEIEFEE